MKNGSSARARKRSAGFALMAAVVALAACDGPNRFSGTPVGTDTARPPEVEIQNPRGDSLSAKPLGDSVLVRVRVSDNQGVDSVRLFGISFRGNAALGTDEVIGRFNRKTVILPAVRDTVVTRYLLAVEDTIKETGFIVAQAFDSDGTMSADTVALILGGPDVGLLNVSEGQSIQAGLNLNLGLIAQDPQGVVFVEFQLTGAIDTLFQRAISPPADSVRVDTIFQIPPDAVGPMQISARARNSLDVVGQDGPLNLTVLRAGAGDTIRPSVNLTVRTLPRYELTDSLFLQITGQDDTQGSGIVRAGYTARAISLSTGDTVYKVGETNFAPVTGSISRQFGFQTFNVDALSLPDTVVYEFTGYFVDADGNCSAAVAETGVASPCVTVGGRIFAQDRNGFRTTAGHVSGRTVKLPAGGLIADAVIDAPRGNLFLSNPVNGEVEVFRLGTEKFGTAIGAGSQPWGLALTRDGDSLWVANSGGTNFSVIDLTTEFEVPQARFQTPDVVLFDIEVQESDAGLRFITSFFPQDGNGFTDEGQFVAVDAFGNPIYSTVVNSSAQLGTARKAFFPPGSEASEVKLFTEHGGTSSAEDHWAIANVDSVAVADVTSSVTDSLGNTTEVLTSTLAIFDHIPGFPDSVIAGAADLSQLELPSTAAARLAQAGSDITIYTAARWDISSLGFGDTTYVAASADGNWVAIGEGARLPSARVLMYQAAQSDTTRLSGVIPVTDFLTNTAERVRGVAVNFDGTLAMARGDLAYFFSNGLRKEGQTAIQSPELGAGAVFHPLHANYKTQTSPGGVYSPNTHLAFVGSGGRTIDIIDTFRFRRIGSVTIRDIINGPLKATLPSAADNVGLTCASVPVNDRYGNYLGDAVQLYTGATDASPIAANGITEDACVVLKVYAITTAGGVVVVPVRKADVLRDHPARQ